MTQDTIIKALTGANSGAARAMLDAMPLCATLWHNSLNIIACNAEALRMFGLKDAREYIERFDSLSPEFQPDGQISAVKLTAAVRNAFAEGTNVIEWLHQTLNGELIPTEITFARIDLGGMPAVAGYTRDMRGQARAIRELEYRDRLLSTLNHVSTTLLSVKTAEGFEESIQIGLEIIGRAVNADRVRIWRNETINGEHCFVGRYHWLGALGKQYPIPPDGKGIPYAERRVWESKFLFGETINGPLCDMPPEVSLGLERYGIKSMVIIPLFLQDEFWGLLQAESLVVEKACTNEEINMLRSAGLMMVSAINRHEQAAATREADERMSLLFDIMPAGAVFYNKDGLVDCNRTTVEMFGYKKMPRIKSFSELSPEYQPNGTLSSGKTKEVDAMLEGKGHVRFEWMFKRKNGEELPCEVTLLRVEHRGEQMVAGFLRDLREYKAMQREINKAAIAEESNKAKSKFLATMSHEMRTPLNAVIGIVDILSQDPELTVEKREAMQKIYSSGHLLLGIINDLLDLSKIEAGKMELMSFPYELASLIHDTVNLNLMRMGGKAIAFKLEIGPDVPSELYGDELRIKQILNNVLSNSFKYTDEGEISLTVMAEREKPKAGYNAGLVFKVKDTGAGMTREQLAVMFEEYSRFTTEANRATEGTGLGMSITRNLVKLMNGEISVESEVGKGTQFTIMLPQRKATDEVIGQELIENLKRFTFSGSVRQIKSSQIEREPMPYGKVLIVDDVDTNIYVAKGLLAFYRLQTDAAISGYEAIEKIEAGNIYDVIFMDHMMPNMDGIEATKIIRRMGYAKPIVALTANALAGQAELFLTSGFDAFVSKPIDMRELNAALNKYVRDTQPPEVLEAARKATPQPEKPAEGEGGIPTELAKIFTRDAARAIATLEGICGKDCAVDGDFAPYTIQAHAMKAALANIGQTELSEAAGRLEEAGREKNAEIVAGETPAFVEKLSALVERLAPPEKPAATPLSDESRELLNTAISGIKLACESLNKKTAKEELARLKNRVWPRNVQDLLDKLSTHLLHSDFEEAANEAGEFLKGM